MQVAAEPQKPANAANAAAKRSAGASSPPAHLGKPCRYDQMRLPIECGSLGSFPNSLNIRDEKKASGWPLGCGRKGRHDNDTMINETLFWISDDLRGVCSDYEVLGVSQYSLTILTIVDSKFNFPK